MVALAHVLDPMLELMFDAGVTVQEFKYLLRERAVRAATRRVIKDSGRNNKSRVAIITGLPRSEIAKISNSLDTYTKSKLGQHPARRVLSAWFEDTNFLDASGEPADLPIFGKRRSFERLVAMHGGGIPVRAMLDELLQLEAVEILSDQRVKAKSRIPISVGLTTNAIGAVGERCGDLLHTLTNNVRRNNPALFEATSQFSDINPDMIPIVRREIAEQGISFINGANALLKRSRSRRYITGKCRLGVTVYYFEELAENGNGHAKKSKRIQRTNLRRVESPAKRGKQRYSSSGADI